MMPRQLEDDVLLSSQSDWPRLVEQVNVPIDRGEVRRYLGYPRQAAPNRRIDALVEQWIAEAEPLAVPRAAYCVMPIAEKSHRAVRVDTPQGPVEFKGAIGEFLGPIDRLAVFIATAGPRIVQFASEMLASGDTLAGLIINAVGSERAEAAEFAVTDELKKLAAQEGRALTLPYSPGYCGMALTEQRKLFSVLDGAVIGVSLTADCLMVPVKSISGLIGLGPTALVTSQGSPCDRCEMKHCNMRR